MKFIRKNGRIIPIQDKQERTNKIIDFSKGVVNGAIARHVLVKPQARKAFVGFNVADTGLDLFTGARRWKNRKSFGDFVKKEAVGWGVELAGNAVGFGVGHGLIGLARKYKLSKMAKASAYASSKSAISSVKLLGKSNIINATYKAVL